MATKVPSELIANTAILGQHLHTNLGNTGVTANSSGLHIGQDVATSATVQFQTVTGAHAGTIASAATGTTQANTDNSAKMATTAFVTNKIQELIGGAPSTLNDLNELAAAINDDANYNSTLTTALATKATIASPTFAGNTRVNGDFSVGAASGEDRFVVAPQAAGSGTILISYNDAANAYEPLIVDFETLALRTSGTPRISIAGNGDIDLGDTTVKADGQLLVNLTASDVGASVNAIEADGGFRFRNGNWGIKNNDGSYETWLARSLTGNKTIYGEKLTVDVGNSRVGINNSSPTVTFHVNNTGAGSTVGLFEGLYASGGAVNLTEWARSGSAVKAAMTYTDATTDMEFGTTTAHSFALKTGGTRRLNIASGGGIGIPGKLAVLSAAAHGSYDFYNNGTSYFNGSVIVDDALSVTGSSAALTVAGQVQGNSLKAHVGTDSGSQLSLFADASGHCFIAGHTLSFNTGANSARTGRMKIDSSGNITINQTGSAPTNGVMMPGYIEFKGQGWDSNSGSDDMNAKIEMAATYGKVGAGATSPELVFSLQGAGGNDSSSESYVEGMRLVGAGTYNNNEPRLGVGTTAPSKTLDVYSNVNTGGMQITGGTSAANISLHINNTATNGVNWNISSTGGGHGYGDGQLQFGVAYGVPKMKITSGGNVGIGHATGSHTPQKVLEVECPSEDFVTLGARTLGTSGNWAGVHFGYKENTNTYRKSAIVFERTDLTENNAQGKVHIFNGPQSGADNATLSDRALTIHEDGTVQLGRPRALSSETSYTLQPFQFDLDCHVNTADEAAEEKDAVFSKIWRKSAVLHPGQYSNGNYYIGIGVSSADTVSYVVFKVNLDKATSLYASAYVGNSADGTTRANKIYYSLDDTNWTQLNSNNWAAGGNTSSGTIDLKNLPGFQGQVATGQGRFFTGTVFIKFAIEGTGSGHSNLIGWQSFLIRATAQHASLTGGGFGRSKNDLTLSGISNTGHGYTPLLHSYGHQFTGQDGTAIAGNNGGTQTFASNGHGHLEQSIFKQVTTASDGLNGIQVLKSGILHGTFIQDIITIGATGYCSCTVRRYNEAKTNSVPICYTLRTNTDGQWDMINGQFICDVVAGDYITFTYAASSISSMDNGSWSHYGLMLHPSAITSQGTAGTNLPWIHQ